MRNSPVDTVDGTIYIAPGNSGCRVYAIPYPMRPGQSPRDIDCRYQQDWRLAAQLDHQLNIITLDTPFRHLRRDIEGQMGGTFFAAQWQV
ncbi:hypothetical protein [Marinobacter alkaliphilus]|uniref:Uncharacterized protein n=1 Tax=Marinobacter alkaliphilus TaxID=254719 RepID=A0ABZ3E925_9GAMM